MKIYTIYTITNLVNQKKYIGYTSQTIRQRFKDHCDTAKREQKYKIHRAISKYGADMFSISEIYQSHDKAHITSIEDYFIKEFNTQHDDYGYNMANGGQGGNIKSAEQLHKQSIKWKEHNIMLDIKSDPVKWAKWKENRSKGAKQAMETSPYWDSFYQANIKRLHENNPGKNKTPETIQKLSKTQKDKDKLIKIAPYSLLKNNEIIHIEVGYKKMMSYVISQKINGAYLFKNYKSQCGEYTLVHNGLKRIRQSQFKTLIDTTYSLNDLILIIDSLEPSRLNLKAL